MSALAVYTAASPITLVPVADAKAFARVEAAVTADDTLFATLIGAAYNEVEEFTGRSLLTTVWDWWIDGVPSGPVDADDWKYATGYPLTLSLAGADYVELPRPPLIGITTVHWYTTANAETLFAAASYTFDAAGAPGRIILNDGYSWPSSVRSRNSMRFRYTAGYGVTAASVPAAMRLAILELVATAYEHREDQVVGAGVSEMPFSSQRRLMPYRVLKL